MRTAPLAHLLQEGRAARVEAGEWQVGIWPLSAPGIQACAAQRSPEDPPWMPYAIFESDAQVNAAAANIPAPAWDIFDLDEGSTLLMLEAPPALVPALTYAGGRLALRRAYHPSEQELLRLARRALMVLPRTYMRPQAWAQLDNLVPLAAVTTAAARADYRVLYLGSDHRVEVLK